MGTIFVLILVTLGGHGVAMHDFNGKAACQAAGKAAMQLTPDAMIPVRFVCVPKG